MVISVMSFWWPPHSSLSPPPRLDTILLNWVQWRASNNGRSLCSERLEVSVNCCNPASFTATSWLLLARADTPGCPCLFRCHSCRAGEEGEDTSKPFWRQRRHNPIIIRNIHTRRQRRRRILTPRTCSQTGQLVMELSVLSGKRMLFWMYRDTLISHSGNYAHHEP